MTPSPRSRVDLHCHSTASQQSRLGVQTALGLPECATPPEEVLELALARGMDFVTITDHDTLDGALAIADDPRVFLSVELTCRFRGEPQAVHVLCFGLDPDQFGALSERAGDVEAVAELLGEQGIACALAHPFYAVEAPLTPRHRRRLARLFPVWEVRNGARAPELNSPAAIYIETHGGTGVGGSDDHAGVDIGRTYTETPAAADPAAFLAHLRAGRAHAGGEQGSAAKWAHTAMALAVRTLGAGPAAKELDPGAVLGMVERVLREGDARGAAPASGASAAPLGPEDARALLRGWLDAVELPGDERDLLALLQADDFSHGALFRRARRCHERRLARATRDLVAGGGLGEGADALFGACVAAIPYAPAAVFLGREKRRLAARREPGEPPRVALVADAVGATHGVTRTLEELRARGVPGFDVEVIATDPLADRRLGSVADVEVPFYAGLHVGVPALPAIVETLAEGRYDLVHVASPGPAGIAALVIAGFLGVPVVASHHTELGAYARLRSGRPELEAVALAALGALYERCAVVLSPSAASDAALAALGVPEERVARWDRGVDLTRFGPRRRRAGLLPDALNVLYAGRLTAEKGIGLLADAFLAAHARDPRLHLVVAGGGPEEDELRARLGPHATFLGWLEGDALAEAYASADMFLFTSTTDTFGQVLLEAQASGLPVVAVGEGGPCSIVSDGVSGLLREADADALADALLGLAHDPGERRRLAAGGVAAVAGRSWERALARLGAGYARALEGAVQDAAPRHVA